MHFFVAVVPASIALALSSPIAAQVPAPPAASQNPSPMVEGTRAHERLTPQEIRGTALSFVGPAGKSVEVQVPDGARPLEMGHVDESRREYHVGFDPR